MIDFILKLATPYFIKGIISLFAQKSKDIETYSYDAILKANNEFIDKFNDKYGDPLDLFYNSSENQRLIIDSLYHHAGIIDSNDLNPEGFHRAITIDKDALEEYVQILEKHLRENREIDAIYTAKERHGEIRDSLDELKKMYESSQNHSKEVSINLESKVDDYLDKRYVPKTSRYHDRPLDFSLFSLPIFLTEEFIELDHFSKIIELGRNLIALLGEPASGKTTAIRRIIKTAKEQPNPKIIPIRIDYDDIKLPQGIREKTKTLLIINEDEFTKLRLSKRFLFIYDGLNEPDCKTKEKAELIHKRCKEYSESQFLISCRTNEYYKYCSCLFERFVPFTIRRLDQTLQIDFVKNVSPSKISDTSREQLISLFETNSQFSNICNTAFIFLLFLRNYKKDGVIPTSISSIYTTFLTDYMKMEQKLHKVENDIDQSLKLSLLSYIAFIMSKNDKVQIDKDDLLEFVDDNKKAEVEMVFDILLANGLLIGAGEKSDKVKFYQQTLQEFLLAYWFCHNNVYPIHMTINDKGIVKYKDEFEISIFTIRRYEELTNILNLIDLLIKIRDKLDGSA